MNIDPSFERKKERKKKKKRAKKKKKNLFPLGTAFSFQLFNILFLEALMMIDSDLECIAKAIQFSRKGFQKVWRVVFEGKMKPPQTD